MGDYAIEAVGLVKRYGKVTALDGLDLDVAPGTVLGVLGPNGAGKTTAVRILTTLLQPDAGRATVAGIDVARHPDQVRRLIGLSGQYAAVDEYLTGRENLTVFGQLYHLGGRHSKDRAAELLRQFDLTEAADRPVKTYSGGMRRRLDLAASLIAAPPVLFLDEPTTGLDPRSRIDMWQVIADLVSGGVTLLLTTQYLEEADQLADDIAVIDHGRVIARGTADALKSQVGGERLTVVIKDRQLIGRVSQLLTPIGDDTPVVDDEIRSIEVSTTRGSAALVETIRALDAEGIAIDDIALHRPTLDDVFLSLTGHRAEDETSIDESAAVAS
ncbi:MAG TPA: ATP-binding cassette domain-containing protein [Actinomycetes bacterium]|nr:ATP-binding cassette domain-containing protein [Actinomycetes bacterium]